MNFWEMIQKILKGDEPEPGAMDSLVEYDPELLDVYNYVITAHAADDDSKLTISFFKPEQWEMVLSTAEMTGSTAEEIVRGLGIDDVHQMIIASDDWNPDEGLEYFF
jgi:hypothetical protein